MKDEKINFCRWRSPRGLWLPFLIIIVFSLLVLVQIITPDKTIIDYIKIMVAIGIIVGTISLILNKGRSPMIMLISTAIFTILTFVTLTVSSIVLIAITVLGTMMAIGLIKLQDHLCLKKIEKT